LVAAEFSKKQLEKRAREPETPVKCKQCVEAVAAEERKQAAARQAERITATSAAGSSAPAVDISDKGADALQVCTSCGRSLARDSFNRSQLVKGAGKQRCRECVEKAEQSSASASAVKQDAAIEDARKALQAAEVTGSAAQTLAASSKLAALEAEQVTGLKPVVLGKGGLGRGGGWRGRSGSGRGR